MPKAPNRIEQFKTKNKELSDAFSELAKRCHESGPIDEKTRRLVKLALAVGAGLEGATHSAVRHALQSGVSAEEMEHVAILGITTIGFPASMRALSWIADREQTDLA